MTFIKMYKYFIWYQQNDTEYYEVITAETKVKAKSYFKLKYPDRRITTIYKYERGNFE